MSGRAVSTAAPTSDSRSTALELQIEPTPRDARDVEQVIEQQRHALHLARDDFTGPLLLALIDASSTRAASPHAESARADCAIRAQDREKLVLAPIRLAQRLLRALQPTDVEVDAGPTGDLSVSPRIGTPCASTGWYVPSVPSMRCSRYQTSPHSTHSCHRLPWFAAASSGCRARSPSETRIFLLGHAR